MPFDEKDLLQRLITGDEGAFHIFYEQYGPALIGFAAARLSSLEDARDIIHDLFVWLWEERESLAITHSLKAFLFSAVRYRIIDHIRRNSTRREYAAKLQSLQGEAQTATEQALDGKDLYSAIEQAVEQLPARAKQIYRLSRDQHRTISEIAEELQLSPQTVKNQLTTALSHLRSFVSRLAVFLWWF
jgi:RNA polymerase sigma-70 factor (family 1)